MHAPGLPVSFLLHAETRTAATSNITSRTLPDSCGRHTDITNRDVCREVVERLLFHFGLIPVFPILSTFFFRAQIFLYFSKSKANSIPVIGSILNCDRHFDAGASHSICPTPSLREVKEQVLVNETTTSSFGTTAKPTLIRHH